MKGRPFDTQATISKEQLDLIEQFEADYNAIDQFLRRDLRSDQRESFSYLVRKYSERHAGWRDVDLLRRIGDVRNAIVHGKTEPYRYLAIPIAAIAKELTICRERLLNPVRAIPTFQRKVATVSSEASLAHVLENIAQQDFSQFPVYDHGRFRGLLTENGITRWLAHHVVSDISLVELGEVPVAHVLPNEETRPNYKFVTQNLSVDDVRGLFISQELLEAVLITRNRKESEALLGIATRWDIIRQI